eukprot:6180412-Pleurochrysis_carterae.AAC.3
MPPDICVPRTDGDASEKAVADRRTCSTLSQTYCRGGGADGRVHYRAKEDLQTIWYSALATTQAAVHQQDHQHPAPQHANSIAARTAGGSTLFVAIIAISKSHVRECLYLFPDMVILHQLCNARSQRIAVEINSMQKRKAMLISPLALRGDTLTVRFPHSCQMRSVTFCCLNNSRV